MTREELANVKAKLARADEIDAELTMLDRAKHSDVLSGVCGLMDGYREVCGSRKASDLMKLGIETRITQLEQELADITVGEKARFVPIVDRDGKPLPFVEIDESTMTVRKESCCECGEDYPASDLQIHGHIYCAKCRNQDVAGRTIRQEHEIAGGVHP